MALHKEFKNLGQKLGLQVWRIEKMNPVPVPPEQYGLFFSGDCYIVLYRGNRSSNVHLWKGRECSQDESGAGAIFVVQLDNSLGGGLRQFIETQGNESKDFLGYFKHGVIYKKGGVATGFSHVKTNEAEGQCVLKVKGRRKVRATEVEYSWDSFNTGDCFIIEKGKVIYSWFGCSSNPYERLKCSELAKAIRDNEQRGRAEVKIADDGDEPDELLEALGDKPDKLPPGSHDEVAEKTNSNKASLHMVSDFSGDMETTMVTEKTPFKQDLLSQSECYILDNGEDDKIFVWKGQTANPDERSAALEIAESFIRKHNYKPNTQIEVLPAGSESTLFKQFFSNWVDKYETTDPTKTYTVGQIAKVEQIPFDASTLHCNKAMAAQHGMVDDGNGKVEIWRVENMSKESVDCSTYGQFFGGDCYLIHYTYNDAQGREKHIIYFWQGLKCSQDELGASALLTVALDDSMGGVATQIRVTQGKEPAHLVSLFKKSPMIIYLGGTCREHGDHEVASTRLFHIRRSSTGATRAVEVEPTASSLNSNDMFVLKSPDSLHLWKGKGADEVELCAAKYVAKLLGGSLVEVVENDEPSDFWEALGGEGDYQTSATLQDAARPPRLFGCSNKTGRLIAEEVPGEIAQLDLAPDDVMILDTWCQIFIWIGKEANETERAGAGQIAEDYLKVDPSARTGVPVITIKQGQESPNFTGWFQAWDPEMWDKAFSECTQHKHE